MTEKSQLYKVLKECFRISRRLIPQQLLIILFWIVIIIISYYGALVKRDLIDYLTYELGKNPNISVILNLGLILLLLTIFGYLINFFAEYKLQVLSVKALQVMSREALNSLYYSRLNLMRGDILARFVSDIPTLSEIVAGLIPAIVIQIVRITGGAIILWILNWELALFALLLIPFYYFIYKYTSGRIVAYSSEERQSLSKAVNELKQSVDALEFIKRTLSRDYFFDRTWSSMGSWLRNLVKLILYRVFFNQTFNGLYGILGVIILIVGGYLVVIGTTTVGTLVAFVGAVFNIYEPIVNISNTLSQALSAIPYVDRYHKITSMQREDLESGIELDDIKTIEMEHVSLTIEDKPILKDVSIKCEKGKSIAIMGPSGAGKTTIALLLLRLYEPTTNYLKINGNNYLNFKSKSLRRIIYYVPSEDIILKTSFYENITLGESLEEDRVLEAAKVAQVDFIKHLHEVIDPDKLSQGQRQRIALARSIARRPKVLILDEALSGLDSKLEGIILKDIKSYLKNFILIFISHRLSALRRIDKIYVLDKGKVVDVGSHNELYSRCKLYREIVEKYHY